MLSNFDIFTAAGGALKAIVVPINNIPVTDGSVTVMLKATVDHPALSAIEVIAAP